MPKRWLAFDLDGTLIGARERQVQVTVALLHGHPRAAALDRARFWRLKRGGLSTAAALARLGYDPEVVDAVARAWPAEMERDAWLERDRALPGSARVLAGLRDGGAAVAVLTARRRPEGARRSLAASGLLELVDEIAVVDPAQAAAAKAQRLRELGARWMIGDTDSDGTAARTAGVPFVAVSTGQRSPGYLRTAGYVPSSSLHAAVARLRAAVRSAA